MVKTLAGRNGRWGAGEAPTDWPVLWKCLQRKEVAILENISAQILVFVTASGLVSVWKAGCAEHGGIFRASE
jgi:hypothetical protein